MVLTIIIWVYLAFIFTIYGIGGLLLIRRLFVEPKTPSNIRLSIVAILGLSIVAWLASVISLVMKLGLVAHLLILTGAIFLLIFQYDEIKSLFGSSLRSRLWMLWALLLITFLTTLLYAVKTPDNPDTPLYHAQAIRWIEEYPAVPGLGNLEPRLGSNSNWFTLNALFSFSFLGFQSFHLIPSFLFLVSLLYFWSGFKTLLDGDLRLSQIVKLGFIPLSFYALIDEISSPGTDLPVILLYWVILCLWLESIEERDSSPLLQAIVFLFSVLVLTFKVSGIPILLIALQILFQLIRKKEYSTLLRYMILAVLLLLPWTIRTFILTGYWLYPEPTMQFLSPDVDWMVPVERVLSFKQGVQAWSLSSGTTWDEIAGLLSYERLAYWFENLTLNQKAITITALLSPLLWTVFSFLGQLKEKKIAYIAVITLSYVSFLFWLSTAPNLRFGYGFVLALVVLAFAPFIQFVFQRLAKYRFFLLSTVALVFFVQQVNVILGSTRDETRYTEYMILPADYRRVPTDVCSLDGVNISCARNFRQCGYYAFPCVPQIPNNIELRGETLRDGFRRLPAE